MVQLAVQIHPSIRVENQPHRFEGDFEGVSVLDAIKSLLKSSKEVYDLIIENDKNKPGLLFLADRTELVSLGLLEHLLDEDLEIRIVPILHGG